MNPVTTGRNDRAKSLETKLMCDVCTAVIGLVGRHGLLPSEFQMHAINPDEGVFPCELYVVYVVSTCLSLVGAWGCIHLRNIDDSRG